MKESIELFDKKTGKTRLYERDLETVPYDMDDMINSMTFDAQNVKFNERVEKNKANSKDITDNVKSIAKFLVIYFRNQFTEEQAMSLDPKNIGKISDWKYRGVGMVTDDEELGEDESDSKK